MSRRFTHCLIAAILLGQGACSPSDDGTESSDLGVGGGIIGEKTGVGGANGSSPTLGGSSSTTGTPSRGGSNSVGGSTFGGATASGSASGTGGQGDGGIVGTGERSAGGALGIGGRSSGGAANGGATTVGKSSGGTASGGSTTLATGGSGGRNSGGSTAGGATMGGTSSIAGCAAIANPSPSWLTEYQRDIVSRLTGVTEIAAGVKISDRESSANRARVRTYLTSELQTYGYASNLHAYSTGTNVWTEAASAGSGAPVVLGAHFDHVAGCPGANDNASGVALVLAVARYLREIDCRTVPIILAFFDEEEKGTLGSAAFATMLLGKARGVKVAYTADMIGWDSDGDRAIEIEQPGVGIFSALSASKTVGGFTMPLEQTNGGDTDHEAFRAQGIPAVGFCEEWTNGDTTPYYHSAKDTLETVNFAYLASTTAFVNYHFARVARGVF